MVLKLIPQMIRFGRVTNLSHQDDHMMIINQFDK